MSKKQAMTHARVALRDGRTYENVVIPYASPSAADLRIRNQDAGDVIELEIRSTALHSTEKVFDEMTQEWKPRVARSRSFVQVRAGDIESVGEAV